MQLELFREKNDIVSSYIFVYFRFAKQHSFSFLKSIKRNIQILKKKKAIGNLHIVAKLAKVLTYARKAVSNFKSNE